jgi:RHS repeat-associated protein
VEHDSVGGPKPGGWTGPITDYGYDQASRLTSVDDHTGAPIAYTYAADGLRATKTKNTQTTNYTWDRSTVIPEMIAKDSTRYVYDPAGLPLEQIDADGTVSYLHHDRLGSTRLVTNADGSTQAIYTYDAYGNRTSTGSSSVPFGYTGQYTDSDTGLIYLRARYYDPVTGQFLTRDPLEEQTRQPYSYAGDDPINYVDPNGLDFLGIGHAMKHHLRPLVGLASGVAAVGACVAFAELCLGAIVVNAGIQSYLIGSNSQLSTPQKLAGIAAVGALGYGAVGTMVAQQGMQEGVGLIGSAPGWVVNGQIALDTSLGVGLEIATYLNSLCS